MNIYKKGRLIVKSLLVWSAVIIVFPLISLWGSSTVMVPPIVSGKAWAVILVNPSPNVTVSAKTPIVNAGISQTGDFSVTIEFTITANVSKVNMFLEASDLYRGGDVTAQSKIDPIVLNTGRPAEIFVPSGTRITGPSNNVSWLGVGDPIVNFPVKKTEAVTYELSQGDATRNVSCKIWYGSGQGNILSSGQYNGQIRLTATATR